MSYDTYLAAPYLDEDRFVEKAERILASMNKAAEWPEFLEWYVQEGEDEGVINAVKQRDFEAIGGLLYAAFEDYLWEAACDAARRD